MSVIGWVIWIVVVSLLLFGSITALVIGNAAAQICGFSMLCATAYIVYRKVLQLIAEKF